MGFAGLDPEHGLLRWGNYDQTLLLPSTVFEADDRGRSYRMRPCTDAIWLREVTVPSGPLTFFLVPDRPELREVIRGTSAKICEGSKQSTNSWGLRGPSPIRRRPCAASCSAIRSCRGSSWTNRTPLPNASGAYLAARLKTGVSIVNTGVLGYSPEQYYQSLAAFADRFQPQFVVVSIFANDFGEASEVASGGGEWDEGKYWLHQIMSLGQSRRWTTLFVPVVTVEHTLGRRKMGYYPGTISNLLGTSATNFLNPADAFADAHLRLLIEGEERGERPSGCLLYNEQIRDGHFSALGRAGMGRSRRPPSGTSHRAGSEMTQSEAGFR